MFGHSFAGPGYGSCRSVAARRRSDADKLGRFGPIYALAVGDGIEVDRVDGAVAALVGSDTAPLNVLDYANHIELLVYTFVWFS